MYTYNTRQGTEPMMYRGMGQMGSWEAEHGSMMGRGTGQTRRWGAELGSMMGRGTGQMGRWGAEHGSMMGRGTGQIGCWGVDHGSTSHLDQTEWQMPLGPLWERNMDQTLVGLGSLGDPRLLVTSRTSSSSSSSYARHTGSTPSEQVQTLEETVRRLEEENAQMISRIERDRQVQLQREAVRQVQEHMQQRILEANAREQARELVWQQRDFNVLLSDTPLGIRSFARMKEVIVLAPVQECSDMEVDAKLTALKKLKRRKKCRSRKKLLAKGEDTENPNTSVGAFASAGQEMIMQSLAANGDGKSSIVSINALELTASRDICSPAATADQKIIAPAAAVDGKSSVANKNATDLIALGDTFSTQVHKAVSGKTGSGKTVTDSTRSKKSKRNQREKKKVVGDVLKAKVNEVNGETVAGDILSTCENIQAKVNAAAAVDGKSSAANKNATDLIASGDTFSTQVHEAVSGKTGSGKTVTDSTRSKKRKRNRREKKKVVGDVLKAKVNEVSGETVAGDIFSTCESIQGKVNAAAAVDGKSSVANKNATDLIASGDTFSTQVHEAVSGKTGSGITVTDSTRSKKRKRNRRERKKVVGEVLKAKVNEVSGETVAGGIFSTCENIQAKVNAAAAVDGKSSVANKNATDRIASGDTFSTQVHDAVSGKTGSGKTVTDSTRSEKRKRNQREKKKVAGDVLKAKVNEVSGETVAGDILSTCEIIQAKVNAGDILSTYENILGKVNAIDGSSATEVTEAISGEMVLGKTALPDVQMVSKEEDHTDAANRKMRSSATTNLNVNDALNSSLTIGEILTHQNLQNLKADNGETGPGTAAADTSSSKKRKMGKRKNKSPLSGDILNTDWDRLLKKKSPPSSDILNTGWNQWSKGSEIVSKEVDIMNTENTDCDQLKKKSPLSGDILNTGWKCGKNMVPELRENGIHMNEEKFGTYKSTGGYAREYDIAGAKGKECGWIYE